MTNFGNRTANFDKYPATQVNGSCWKGWQQITAQLQDTYKQAHSSGRYIIVIECYQGVYTERLKKELQPIAPQQFISTGSLFKPASEIEKLTAPILTGDPLFGYRTVLSYADLFDAGKVNECRARLEAASGLIIVCGHGAAEVIPEPDLLVYADMSRWEIQQRTRRHEINGLGVENCHEAPSYQYKRGYFLDWIICDNLKKHLINKVDYWLDTHHMSGPVMIDGTTWQEGLANTVQTPFRVVPFFDPAPWGGQWMKEVCGLDKSAPNYGWCFDCVPEENSLYLEVNGTRFEMPANNLVFYKTRELLGEPVEARFGQDFPIRFDFLDTMEGGNLSLQVHPTTQYIRDQFGMSYTQDESYYLLDAVPGATVYLGLKEDIDPVAMATALNRAQQEGASFEAEQFVNSWPASKHDHYLIPAGTVHCSGKGAMVLEISATPSIFTFKLWDWGRMGLDGKPRPINIKHGMHVINWERRTEYTRRQLVNRIEKVAEGEGWCEERTGLHENEFIETRRHWFTVPVTHHTGGGVNVLNLIEGDEAIVESPSGLFKPFVVHYAETFIVPAAVGSYTIRPYGASAGKRCGTIKAYVRFRQ